MSKALYKRIVEETDQDGTITHVQTLITADKFSDVYDLGTYEHHENMELISISKVGDVATDLTTNK